MRIYVLDGVTAFASYNPNQDLSDPPVNGATLGINPNDVRQGGVGDCYFMAAELALATEEPTAIEDLITDNHDGTFTVQLYSGVGTKAPAVTYSANILSNGFYMAQLSGDYNSSNGKVEIWPQLLEKAWADLKGSYAQIGDGTYGSDAAWTALTGKPAASLGITPDMTNQDIATQILIDLYVDQAAVSIGTKKDFGGVSPILDAQKKDAVIHEDHAYVVVEPKFDNNDSMTSIVLANPWGSPYGNITVPVDDFTDFFSSITSLTP